MEIVFIYIPPVDYTAHLKIANIYTCCWKLALEENSGLFSEIGMPLLYNWNSKNSSCFEIAGFPYRPCHYNACIKLFGQEEFSRSIWREVGSGLPAQRVWKEQPPTGLEKFSKFFHCNRWKFQLRANFQKLLEDIYK